MYICTLKLKTLMNDLKDYDISFVGLKDGSHQFEYVIDNAFFEFFEYEDFNSSKVNVQLDFLKKPTMFELLFNVSGEVEVACDVTNELFFQSVENQLNLIVKFGDEFNNENEELLVIPHGEFKLNVAQFIYEAIVLAVPIKKVHPGVEDGTLESEVLERLKEYELSDGVEEIKNVEEVEIDPRWDKLKNILKEKNKSNGTS